MMYAYYFQDVGNTVRWLRAPNKRAHRLVGQEVASINGHGYLQVSLHGKKLQVHRILWEMRYGPIPPGFYVDHIDGNKLNNLPTNLRLAEPAQNSHNMRRSGRNSSGVKGLSYIRTRGVWVGSIHVRGKAHKFQSKHREAVEQWLHRNRPILHGGFAKQ